MSRREDSLVRPENSRERCSIQIADFSLEEIKEQFEQNVREIKDKFGLAEKFLQEGQEDYCKDMWRTQIVF